MLGRLVGIETFPDGTIVADGSGYTVPGIPVLETACVAIGT